MNAQLSDMSRSLSELWYSVMGNLQAVHGYAALLAHLDRHSPRRALLQGFVPAQALQLRLEIFVRHESLGVEPADQTSASPHGSTGRRRADPRDDRR